MKNYNEMATDVFRRIGEYETEQKRKRKRITCIVTSFCCVCVAALMSFGIWQSRTLDAAPPSTLVDSASIGEMDLIEESQVSCEETSASDNNYNKIIVHQIDAISADRMNIALMCDDFIAMDKAALNEYYGIDVTPSIPADLKQWEDQQYGIYRRNGGTGEVYWDGNIFTFSNEDFSRSVNVEIKKHSMPFCNYLFYHSTEEKSVIGDIEIAIGQYSNGYYYAQFMYQNVGFQIVGEGITQDELITVISSLIQ